MHNEKENKTVGRPLRILSVLGQRPGDTGSGILVRELWRCGQKTGDAQRLLCAGYAGDRWSEEFGENYRSITFSRGGEPAEAEMRIPGMSDVMPYDACRYRDLSDAELEGFVSIYRRALQEMVSEFAPDIIHVHHLWALAAMAPDFPEIPFVVTVHGTDLKQAKLAPQHRGRVESALDRIRHVFCVSREMVSDTIEEYGADAERLSVLGNGFDPDVFCVDGEREPIEGRVVLCAGKFVGWKGFSHAIRAASSWPEDTTLVILGTGPEESRLSLESEAEQSGARVSFPGHLSHPEVARWMRRADVFLLPSIHEPFGLVLLEALACGCRVVAGASGGPLDIISPALKQAGDAILVAPLDEAAENDRERYSRELAEATQTLLMKDASIETRREIASTVAHMTWANVYDDMRRGYCQVL